MIDIPTAPALEVNAVDIAFDRSGPEKGDGTGREKIRGLFDISFELSVGRSLAVIGPSASGKTTLGLMCAGLLVPRSGSIRHFGVDVYSSRWLHRRTSSSAFMVFQDPYSSINPRETVLSWLLKAQHALSLPLAVKKDSAVQTLEAVNLSTEHLSRYPGQLSGGQCQRVAIAAGLLTRARILIFDEPTSMLDPIAKRDLLPLLKRINSEFKISIMFVTHDILSAMLLCESAIVLVGGRIVANGSFPELEKSTETIVRRLLVSDSIG
jgi:ABC-type glutathione transport system ATPase component